MNEPQPHPRIARKTLLRDVGSGVLWFFGLNLAFFMPLGLFAAAFPDAVKTEPMSIGAIIFVAIVVAFCIVFYVGVPIFVTVLLIRDILRIIKDQDPVFWYKRWYRRLSVSAVLAVLLMIVAGLSPDDRATSQPKSLGYSYFGQAVAADGSVTLVPPGPGADILQPIKLVFLVVALSIIGIIFLMTAYVTFFIDETESNRKRIGFASDIFKTILGFVTGLITAVFGLR
jgi:hypothetical protein